MNAAEVESLTDARQACSTERDWLDVVPPMAQRDYEYRDGSWYLLAAPTRPRSAARRWSILNEIPVA